MSEEFEELKVESNPPLKAGLATESTGNSAIGTAVGTAASRAGPDTVGGVQCATLGVITWPDPGLKKPSEPVTVYGENLARLASRMLELMRLNKGVGLAAPQVGLNLRLFVVNATGKPEDDR